MYIASLGNNHMTVCAYYDDALIHSEATNARKDMEKLRDQLQYHISVNPKCKAHYDALPTFSDMQGITPNATGGLSSGEFVRKLRSDDDE